MHKMRTIIPYEETNVMIQVGSMVLVVSQAIVHPALAVEKAAIKWRSSTLQVDIRPVVAVACQNHTM